jgi:hypothetical protein
MPETNSCHVVVCFLSRAADWRMRELIASLPPVLLQ